MSCVVQQLPFPCLETRDIEFVLVGTRVILLPINLEGLAAECHVPGKGMGFTKGEARSLSSFSKTKPYSYPAMLHSVAYPSTQIGHTWLNGQLASIQGLKCSLTKVIYLTASTSPASTNGGAPLPYPQIPPSMCTFEWVDATVQHTFPQACVPSTDVPRCQPPTVACHHRQKPKLCLQSLPCQPQNIFHR